MFQRSRTLSYLALWILGWGFGWLDWVGREAGFTVLTGFRSCLLLCISKAVEVYWVFFR